MLHKEQDWYNCLASCVTVGVAVVVAVGLGTVLVKATLNRLPTITANHGDL